MKNEKVELTGISRFYLIEYERDDGDNVSAVIEEMWDGNTDSITAEIVSGSIDGVDIEMLKPLPQKVEQELEEEILQVFEKNRR